MNALTPTARGSWAIPAPQTMQEAMRMAEMLANSTMVPKCYQGRPGDVLVAVQMGAELGLAPLQALQNIASVNGRPSLWGDAALALCQRHPAFAGHREWVEGEGDRRAGFCAVTRRGSPEHVQGFSVADAKRGGLWGKAGPWQAYSDRMLVLRARGFALRDKFADALRGLITVEEARDIPADAGPALVGAATPDASNALPAPPVERREGEGSARKFTFEALDDQLAQFHDADELRAYLAQPKVEAARERVARRGAEWAERWAETVQRHFARVLPGDALEPEEPDDDAGPIPDARQGELA